MPQEFFLPTSHPLHRPLSSRWRWHSSKEGHRELLNKVLSSNHPLEVNPHLPMRKQNLQLSLSLEPSPLSEDALETSRELPSPFSPLPGLEERELPSGSG